MTSEPDTSSVQPTPRVEIASELERRRRELAALQAIALVSNRGLDVRSVVDTAVEVAHAALKSDLTCFYRFDSERRVLVLEHHRGLDAGLKPDIQELALGTGMTGKSALTGKAVLARDYSQEANALPGIVFRGYNCVMAAPVKIQDELLGTLNVSAFDNCWESADLDVFSSIGVQLGTALENARLLERLRASEARYRTVVEAAPNVVYEADTNGHVLYMSPKVQELTGYRAERFDRDPAFFSTLIHPEDRAARLAKLRTLSAPGDRTTSEYRLLHANGVDIVWVADHAQARAARAREPGPIVVTGALADLRERKVIEAAAREQSRLASLGELAAGVAHEVNNPLSGIINYGQLAKRILERLREARSGRPDPNVDRLDEPLDGILAEAERILEIMRTLVSFARRPEKEAFRALAPLELVRASLTILKQRLKEDSIALEVSVPPELPAVRARGHELTQVLQNLITNARAALNDRFPRWERAKVLSLHAERVPPDERAPAGYVRFRVRDAGSGIAPENLSKVFVPFFTTKTDGTGLGLPIAKEIVESHGGAMTVESRPDLGTTISFTVPVY
jgi:PAS domain S-box-containing protein